VGRILKILKILYEKTDECTSITQSEILSLLEEDGYNCSARTLTDYLKMIMRELNPEEADGYVEDHFTIDDYRIIPKGLEDKLKYRDFGLLTEGSKKLQLRSLKYNHIFSFHELNQIMEALLFQKNIDDIQKMKLIKKLQLLTSDNFPKYSPYISENTGNISKNITGVYEDSRIDQKMVRSNLNIIRQALEHSKGLGCKIAFNFNGYNSKKELEPRRNNEDDVITYVVDPFYIILYNGKYYLICSIEPYNNVSIFSVSDFLGCQQLAIFHCH